MRRPGNARRKGGQDDARREGQLGLGKSLGGYGLFWPPIASLVVVEVWRCEEA